MILLHGKNCLKCGRKKKRRVNEAASDFIKRKYCSSECASLTRSEQASKRHPLHEKQMTPVEVEQYLNRTENEYWNFISPCDKGKGYR